MIRKRKLVAPVFFGLFALSNIALNPRFQQIRTVDVMALTGCGACIGVAVMSIIMALRSRTEP